jgi:ribosomal protein S27AE
VLVMVMERVLIGLGLLAGYAVLVTVKPKRRCPKCSGNGSRKGRRSARSACGKCGATGRAFMPGARLVHAGAVLAVDTVREHIKQRREDG